MVPGWRDWYRRVSAVYSTQWITAGIASCLKLSLADYPRNDTLLSAACYFWSDALNCFMFGHGPATMTLLDAVMLADLNVTSTEHPSALRFKSSHRINPKETRGWKKYIQAYNKGHGPVEPREHVAFLNMWLDNFVFCGASVSPTANYVQMAEKLAGNVALPLGKYLLGAAYLLLHQVSVELRYGRPVKNFGGPWWFIQMWLTLHSAQAVGLDLRKLHFPGDYAESAAPTVGRCLSFGEAVIVAPGAAMSDDGLAMWFTALYKGFTEEGTWWYPYVEMYERGYDTPVLIDPTMPADSGDLFSTCFRPCLLPTGLAAGARALCSYEFYHPSVAARQLGFGQLPPSLFFVGRLKARAHVENSIEWNFVSGLTADLVTGGLADFVPSTLVTRLFARWWNEWGRHLQCRSTASYLSGLELSAPSVEVPFCTFSLGRFYVPKSADCLWFLFLLSF